MLFSEAYKYLIMGGIIFRRTNPSQLICYMMFDNRIMCTNPLSYISPCEGAAGTFRICKDIHDIDKEDWDWSQLKKVSEIIEGCKNCAL